MTDHTTDPGYCELCGRTEPVTRAEVTLQPLRWKHELDMAVIRGNECYMLPAFTYLTQAGIRGQS